MGVSTVWGPKKARKVSTGIIQRAMKHDLRRFLTLTLDQQRCRAEDSAIYIREVWRKMRVLLKRRVGKSISFIAVLEFQKNGYAHLHVMLGHYLPQEWLSEAWHAVGGGRYVDIRFVDMHRVASYVSKYLTKEMLLSKATGKYRRYTTSRDIVLLVKTKQEEWWLIKMSLKGIRRSPGCCVLEEKHDETGELCSFTATERIL